MECYVFIACEVIANLGSFLLLHLPFENTDILSCSYSMFNNHMLSDDFYLRGGQSFPSALPIQYKAETKNAVSFNDTVSATRQ